MRNPNRIDMILGAISHVWREQPDIRLGQLISNAAQRSGSGTDVFYLEDDDLYNELFRMAKEMQRRSEGGGNVQDSPSDS